MSETAQATTIRMYASIRDQLASEITAGVYPAGALLPSIREIMERWEVSTTTARKVLDELAAAGYARKESTRGAISTGGPQPGPAPSQGEPARKAPPPAAVPGRSRRVIVRRRLAAAPDNTPVQFRISYVPAELAEGTPIAQSTAITDAWPAALTTYLGKQVRLASSQVTARHPNHEEAAALALPSDAAVLVREDTYEDRRGSPVDFTRTVWPGDTTRLVVGG